jgi:hypothetical protein
MFNCALILSVSAHPPQMFLAFCVYTLHRIISLLSLDIYPISLKSIHSVRVFFLRHHATSSNGEDKVHVGYVIARGAMATCWEWSYIDGHVRILSTNWKPKSRNIPLSRRWLGIVRTRSHKHINLRHVLLTFGFQDEVQVEKILLHR